MDRTQIHRFGVRPTAAIFMAALAVTWAAMKIAAVGLTPNR